MRRRVKLKDVCLDVTVGHVGPMADEYVDDGIPFLRSQNILPFRLDDANLKFINEAFHKRLKKSALSPGDVVVVRTGYPGTACVIPNRLPVANCADLVVIRPSDEIDGHYLCCIFNSAWGKSTVSGSLVGVAQQHFNIGVAKELEFTLPPLPLQERIASILSAYDDLIENNIRRIKILEHLALMLYREWFVNFRFPGHEKVRMVESQLGLMPEGWSVQRVEDFGAVVTGKTPSTERPEFFGRDIPFIKTPDMHGNLFCVAVTDHLSALGANSQKKKTIPANSIMVNCIGALAGSVSITARPAQTNQQINSVVLNNQKHREFLYLSLTALREKLRQIGSNGATMINVNKTKFEGLEIVTPPADIGASFHGLTCAMFEETRNLQTRNINLRTTRDFLLPKLISGEVPVEAAAELVEQTA